MTTRIADDYASIRLELERIEREKKAAVEMPKAWPFYAASDQDYTPCEYVYRAPDEDCG